MIRALAALLLLQPGLASAKASADEAAQLGKTLTPIGAEQAANAAGTIPAWTGGLPQQAMPRGDNPFAADKPLFTITAANYKQYDAELAEGYKALFQTFPDYRMAVYPSHRSASYPPWFYEATKRNATAVDLTDNGFGFCCAAQGYPFPIPKTGIEVLWNHLMRYNTRGYRGYADSAEVSATGEPLMERSYFEVAYAYNDPAATPDKLGNQNLFAMLKTVAPPSKAGTADLLHVPLDRIKEETGVWDYNPGMHRVRRIGEVGYDNPLFDGLMTHDQVDMFNGPTDRYQVELLGKREMLVPYNSYELYSPKHKYADILRPGHINPDLARYELHRVWVIQATLRPGISHTFKTRRFYVDEDSWDIEAVDCYDNKDQLYKFQEGHLIFGRNVQSAVTVPEVIYDFFSGRYFITATFNEDQPIDQTMDFSNDYFTPASVQKMTAK